MVSVTGPVQKCLPSLYRPVRERDGIQRRSCLLLSELQRFLPLKKGLGLKHSASGAVDLKSALFKGGKRFAERKLTCIFWSLIDSIFFPPWEHYFGTMF